MVRIVPSLRLAFLGLVAKSAPSRRLSLLSRRRPSTPRSSRERPALDDHVRYPGLLAAYLPCERVSQEAAKEARPPTRTSLLAPTCRIDGWMLHRTRSDNGQLGPIYALTCEARVAESMRESWGLMDYSTRAEERPTNNKRGAGSKAVRGGRCFLRLDGAAEDGPSAHDRGSSGD